MALKPSYNDKLHLPGLSKTEILILALEASQKLEWNIEEVTPEGARFEVPFNMYSHGEEITFTIEPGSDGEVQNMENISLPKLKKHSVSAQAAKSTESI